MKIGIIGSGNMGRTFGGAWAEAGHVVFFGSRDEKKGKLVASEIGRGTQGGTNDQAAEFGDVLLYTVRLMPSEVLRDVRVTQGKMLIDCNNREIPEDLSFGPPPTPSFAERIAADCPGLRVVKALNTMPQEVFNNPPAELRRHNVACFLTGDDPAAKQIAAGLAGEIGLVPIDCGRLAHAWLLEAAGDLIRYVIIDGKRWTGTFGIAEPPPAPPRFGGARQKGYR